MTTIFEFTIVGERIKKIQREESIMLSPFGVFYVFVLGLFLGVIVAEKSMGSLPARERDLVFSHVAQRIKTVEWLKAMNWDGSIGTELHLLSVLTNGHELGVEAQIMLSTDENGAPLNLLAITSDNRVKDLGSKSELPIFFPIKYLPISINIGRRTVLSMDYSPYFSSFNDIQLTFKYVTNVMLGKKKRITLKLFNNQLFSPEGELIRRIHVDFASFLFTPLGVKNISFNEKALKKGNRKKRKHFVRGFCGAVATWYTKIIEDVLGKNEATALYFNVGHTCRSRNKGVN